MNELISKRAFIDELKKETGYNKKDLAVVIEAIDKLVIQHLVDNDSVRLTTNIKFSTVLRNGRDCWAGSEYKYVPAHRYPKAKFMKYAVDRVKKENKVDTDNKG